MNTKSIHAPPPPFDAAAPARGGGRPYRTGIYALLLAFAIAAGAATASDAFAQSNTDRLIGLVDTTNRNNGMLDAIQNVLGGLGEQITAVQNAIMALAESVAALSGDTADMAADVSGLTGKVDTANERIAGLDGKVDAVGTGVAGLTGKVDSVNTNVDGVGAKVDAANTRINELSGKVDTINVCTGDLNAKVDAIESTAAGLHARAASVGSTVDAVKEEVDGLKTMMADHANTNRLDPSHAERLDAIPDIRAALDALGDRPDETAALDEISDGIKANSARIAALEDTINMIDSQIAGVTGKLGTVGTAVEQRVGPAPTNLYKSTEKLVVTIGHFGDSAKGKEPSRTENAKLTAAFAFSCKADVFVGKVSTVSRENNFWASGIGRATANYAVTVGGETLRSDWFDTGSGHVDFPKDSLNFNLMELKSNGTLDVAADWTSNHANTTSGSGARYPSGVGAYIVTPHGQNITSGMLPGSYTLGATPPLVGTAPYTKAQVGAVDVFALAVEYYSAAEKAECSFKRTSGFSTELTKGAQKVLSVKTGTGQLVNGFEAELSCNNLPAMVTGINAGVPGGLSLYQYSTFQLLSGTGDKEKVHSVFKFNPNGTITHSGGDFPFTFEGAPLRINGTLAGASSLLVVVDYKTTEDNSCQ